MRFLFVVNFVMFMLNTACFYICRNNLLFGYWAFFSGFLAVIAREHAQHEIRREEIRQAKLREAFERESK